MTVRYNHFLGICILHYCTLSRAVLDQIQRLISLFFPGTMNDSQCAVFLELSNSVEYHILSAIKAFLCLAGALRLSLQWKRYGVRFLVHENTKIIFRFFLALNIIVGIIFGWIHLFEMIRLRFDCFLLDFRYILLTRGAGVSLICASQNVLLLISFERLYSALYPANFEKCSRRFLSISLALIATLGTTIYGISALSDQFRLFEVKNGRALLSINIPENQIGFKRIVKMSGGSNFISLLLLCVDFYINFLRKRKINPSLGVAYQMIENRRIVLDLIPIELVQTMLNLFTGMALLIHRKVVTNPTPVGQQLIHESVTLGVCFPLILTFFIKRSAERSLNRPRPIDPVIDHFETLRKSWDR
ncbi:hypothetical protein PRIPAC_92657 [Pristionchus pacificus]|uniref:Uncharacterized protein n=1 Tax=Pristionchus pacificus TaxID=54126 RepID=A0A2A6BPC1_PRIPA|nr:hypothetical protein PRIPAC_92657 [Pristionchus pacificus]|eukprot:PDM67688.1 hypothetical protein PRIPAC_45732 [Pristionchus pacificus]